MSKRPEGDSPFVRAKENVATMLGRFEEILNRLGQVAEGKDYSQSGELVDESGDSKGKEIRGVYGFSVHIGSRRAGPSGPPGRGPSIRVEPFGTVRRSPTPSTSSGTGGAAVPVREIREPIVDVLEEDGALLIVAELPGVATEQVKWEVEGDVLTLRAELPSRSYLKEILLPALCVKEGAVLRGSNGVIELRLMHERRAEPPSEDEKGSPYGSPGGSQ